MAKLHDPTPVLNAHLASELAGDPALAAERTRFFRSLPATVQQLRGYLSGGPRPCKTVESRFLASGHSRAVLQRAKSAAAVRSTKIGKIWYWSLSPIPAVEKEILAILQE